jgi:translation initiation factor 5B
MENNKPTSDVENPPTMKSPVTDEDGDDNGVEVVCPMPQQDDKVTELGSREKEGEDETVESAAAKKKRKKKEKEKEKKAAAAVAAAAGSAAVIETVEEKAERIDSKTNKKVPKHVREMQELLARRKEDEERKKREEEERLRKEKEERQRLEELQRLEEEAKRIKKEKGKQKLLKKKQEGKLLTDKQKQEARRLEAMRRQILNSIGGVNLPVVKDTGAPAKKPVYQTRTGRSTNRNQNGEASVKTDESGEAKETITDLRLEELSVRMEDNVQPPEAVEDEWDERSWDDVNLNDRGAFADEEIVHLNAGEICILLIILNFF